MSKLQAAGVSRRDRYKGAHASTRQITKRDSHGLNSSRRESGALPFDGDSAPGAPVDTSFEADDADEGEADQTFGGDDDEGDEADTMLDSTSTPRSTRRSPARSAAKHSPAASPAAAASSSSAAAAAAPSSTRSTRHSVAASPAAAKSGRKSSAAAAAAMSPSFSPAAASSSPAASSPSVAGSPSFSPVMAGGRARTKRADDLRTSTSFALPFSRGPSRAPSMAPSHAGGGADEDDEDDEDDARNRYALPEDVSFVAGDDGYGDEDAADDETMQEERKSAGSSKKRPSSAGGAPAAAAAASSSSSAAAAAAVPSKRAAPAPKRPRAEAGTGAASGAGGKGKGVGRKTMQIVETGRKYDGLGSIGEEKDGFASDAEGSPAVNKRPKRTHIPPTAWWEMKEVNYLIDQRGLDGTMAHIDPEHPIKQLTPNVVPKERVRPKPHKKPSSSSAAAAAAPKPKEREVKNKPIPANMQIVDATGAEITVPAVAKHADHIPLESLGGAGVDPKSLPFPLPHGGKAFEQPEFSSGLLMLPPRAKKQLEEANNNEVFYVIEGPANMLQVTVHHTVLHLSKGQSHNRATACEPSQFMIPTGNRYSMQNLSHTESITIFFVLVKPAQTWMNEWHEQHKAQEEEALRQEEAQHEEPEEEDDEDAALQPPPPRKKAQAKRK